MKLTIQSLNGWQTDGKVSYIAPAADTSNGVVTYAVRVSFPDNDPKVRVGMTADLNIVVGRRRARCWCRAALLPKGAGRACKCQGRHDPPGGRKDGLRDDTKTEILSGLNEGD